MFINICIYYRISFYLFITNSYVSVRPSLPHIIPNLALPTSCLSFFFKSPIKQISDAHICMDIHKSWSIETMSGPMLRKKMDSFPPSKYPLLIASQ